jgi:hypothetical protein
MAISVAVLGLITDRNDILYKGSSTCANRKMHVPGSLKHMCCNLAPIYSLRLLAVGVYPPVRRSKDNMSVLGVRNLALNHESHRTGFRGILEPDLGIHIYQLESINFCFGSINTVHLTVYTVPRW